METSESICSSHKCTISDVVEQSYVCTHVARKHSILLRKSTVANFVVRNFVIVLHTSCEHTYVRSYGNCFHEKL